MCGYCACIAFPLLPGEGQVEDAKHPNQGEVSHLVRDIHRNVLRFVCLSAFRRRIFVAWGLFLFEGVGANIGFDVHQGANALFVFGSHTYDAHVGEDLKTRADPELVEF